MKGETESTTELNLQQATDADKNQKNIYNTNNVAKRDELELNDILPSILALVHRVAFEEKTISQKGKKFPNAFEIDENFIRKINNRVMSRFKDLETVPGDTINFRAEVRFCDLQTNKFSGLEKLIDKASDKKDPESLRLQWKVLLKNPIASQAIVTITFMTEKRLDTEELSLGQVHHASMSLDVGGPTDEWTERVYNDLEPFLEASKIGGIYKPLLFFRNKDVISFSSMGISMLFYFFLIEFLNRYFSASSKEERLNKIIAGTSLEERFELFVNDVFLSQSDLTEFVAIMGISFSFLLLMYFSLLKFLPLLVPRSFISIGLAKYRIEKYQNAFRLITFTIILSGLILPLIRKIIL